MRSDAAANGLAAALHAVLLAVLLAATVAGCAGKRTVLPISAADTWEDRAGDFAADFEFWDAIVIQRVVTNNDVLLGMLMVSTEPEEDDPVPDRYDDRLAIARDRGWVEDDDEPIPEESARLGMISMAACDILAVKGGVTMRFFGPSPRYCTRELVYLQLIPRRTDQQSLSGLEFVDLISRIQDYKTQELARAAAKAAKAGKAATDPDPSEMQNASDPEDATAEPEDAPADGS